MTLAVPLITERFGKQMGQRGNLNVLIDLIEFINGQGFSQKLIAKRVFVTQNVIKIASNSGQKVFRGGLENIQSCSYALCPGNQEVQADHRRYQSRILQNQRR